METMRGIGLVLVVLCFITAAYFYPTLPERLATHWNVEGQVDGYLDKGIGTFLLPSLMLGLFVLFICLPKLDPLKENYKRFMKEYDMMIALFCGFLYYIFLLVVAFNMGHSFDFGQLLSPAFGALFFFLGHLIQKAKQNWFVGIRTPWTLSSEKVWDRTHKIAGSMFKAAGIVAVLGLLLPQLLMASVAILIAITVFSVVYSYMVYKDEIRK